MRLPRLGTFVCGKYSQHNLKSIKEGDVKGTESELTAVLLKYARVVLASPFAPFF